MMIIPVVVMIITFLATKNQPNSYTSHARISAGIVDQTQKIFLDKEDQVQDKVNQSFSNLLQMIQMKAVFDQVSYQLILNDLTTDKPFKKPSKLLMDLNSPARKHAVEVYSKMYLAHQPLSPMDPDQKGLVKVLASMGYNADALKKKFTVYRIESSDFIDLTYESENPMMSAFVINAVAKEFIAYYTYLTKQNELKALNFVTDQLKQKKDSLDMKNAALMDYKIKNRILNLNEETKSLYVQRSDFETRMHLAENEVNSKKGAINELNEKLCQNSQQYQEGVLSPLNKDIVRAKDKLNALNDEYIKTGFKAEVKQRIDSLRTTIQNKITQAADRPVTKPTATKDNLMAERLKLEIDLSLAENSISSLKTEYDKVSQRLDSLVPHEAVIAAMEGDINVAQQEYLELLKRYNEVSAEYNSAIRIKQVEAGMPDDNASSKKAVTIIVAGVVCAVLYFLILFVLFYIDNSIKYPEELEKATDMKVLGHFPVIKSSFLEIQKLWDRDSISEVDKEFRNLLRSARFEVQLALADNKILAVTSLKNGAGKTLCALSLASAYHMVGKKVLLIDGNFINSEITRIAEAEDYIEDYLEDRISMERSRFDSKMKMLGNKGADTTLFEINNDDWIKQKLAALKDQFDIIIIEIPSLDTLNESREWIEVSDCLIAVFQANESISREMKKQIEYLRAQEGKFIGWILNKVTTTDYKVSTGKKAL